MLIFWHMDVEKWKNFEKDAKSFGMLEKVCIFAVEGMNQYPTCLVCLFDRKMSYC